jgi:hypothetical protein
MTVFVSDGRALFCPTALLFRCCSCAVIQEQHNRQQTVDNVSENSSQNPT